MSIRSRRRARGKDKAYWDERVRQVWIGLRRAYHRRPWLLRRLIVWAIVLPNDRFERRPECKPLRGVEVRVR